MVFMFIIIYLASSFILCVSESPVLNVRGGSLREKSTENNRFEDQEQMLDDDVYNKSINEDSITKKLFAANTLNEDQKKCSRKASKGFREILKSLNISLLPENIINSKMHGEKINLEDNTLIRLHFTIILDINKLLPSRIIRKPTEKAFLSNDKYSSFQSVLSGNYLKLESIKRVMLRQSAKNFRSQNASQIKITIDIDTIRNDYYKNEFSENDRDFWNTNESVFSRFFHLSNRRRRPIRVQKFAPTSIYIGTALALISSILCGLSFVLKKRSLICMDKKKSYYQDKAWWMGHSLMMVGDVLHYVAFYFAPAIVVCTLQMLTVLVAAVASTKLLGERMNKHAILAFALSLGGCWVIVFHAPNEPHIYSIETLISMLTAPIFVSFILILCSTAIFIQCSWIPKWGKVNSVAYALQSSIFGSIVVVGLKGLLVGITDTLFHWLPWISLLIVATGLILQLECLNNALKYYNTLVVTTQYYVLYSAGVILSSTLLFKVWKTSSYETIFSNFCGFTSIALGVLIFTVFHEENATFDFSKLFAGPDIHKYYKF